MLRELRIKNFAVIDEAALELGAGLNVLTGETGAGKTIVLNALGLICGGKGLGGDYSPRGRRGQRRGAFCSAAAAVAEQAP